MAFACLWPCVADNQLTLSKPAQQPHYFPTMATIIDPLPQPNLKGDSLSIKTRRRCMSRV